MKYVVAFIKAVYGTSGALLTVWGDEYDPDEVSL